jgi:hypothetical protein
MGVPYVGDAQLGLGRDDRGQVPVHSILDKVSETCTPVSDEAKRPSHSAKYRCPDMGMKQRQVKPGGAARGISRGTRLPENFGTTFAGF